jgi:hypothetical protein
VEQHPDSADRLLTLAGLAFAALCGVVAAGVAVVNFGWFVWLLLDQRYYTSAAALVIGGSLSFAAFKILDGLGADVRQVVRKTNGRGVF